MQECRNARMQECRNASNANNKVFRNLKTNKIAAGSNFQLSTRSPIHLSTRPPVNLSTCKPVHPSTCPLKKLPDIRRVFFLLFNDLLHQAPGVAVGVFEQFSVECYAVVFKLIGNFKRFTGGFEAQCQIFS